MAQDFGSRSATMSTKAKGNVTTGSNIMSRISLNDNKAGMEGLDKEKINQIIYEASKDSKFYMNEKKKEEQLELRIKDQQDTMSKLTKSELIIAEQEANKALEILETKRELSRTIVHVDMDAFYAAVEMRDNPALRNKPMAVGGMGMLSTSNYLARRFGVRAAMPGFIGLKLCPDLVIVRLNFEKYQSVSRDIREVISLYDPDFCPMGLDEAYLDLTTHLQHRQQSSSLSRMFLLRETLEHGKGNDGANIFCTCDLNIVLRPQMLCLEELRQHGGSDEAMHSFLTNSQTVTQFSTQLCGECKNQFPSFSAKIYGRSVDEAVLELRNRIEQRTKLTASAGIAPNMMLAKVCSDKNKPNGQYQIQPVKSEIMEFIRDLPIRKISGIGKVTEKLLGSLGVVTCSDLFTHRALLYSLFSQTSFHHFMRITSGIGSTSVERDGERKSMSTEQTFGEMKDPEQLMEKCRDLCHSLSDDMKEEGLLGKTLTLKIKTVSFDVKTRSITLSHATNNESALFKAAQGLLQTEIDTALPSTLCLRLMGVRMSKLSSETDSQVSVAEMFRNVADRKGSSHATTLDDNSSKSSSDPIQTSKDMAPCMPDYENLKQNEHSDDESEEYSRPLETEEIALPCMTATEKNVPLGLEKSDGTDEEKASSNNLLRFLKPTQQSQKSTKGFEKTMLNKDKQKTESNKLLQFLKPNQDLEKVDQKRISRPEKPEAQSSSSSSIQTLQNNNMQSGFFRSSGRESTSELSIDTCHLSGDFQESYNPETGEALSSLSTETKTIDDDPLQPQSPGTSVTNMVSCPVCRQQKLNWPLDQLNTHIDLCLSKQTVKEMLHQDTANSRRSELLADTSKKRQAASTANNFKGKRRKEQPSVISYFKL